jgi:hypothetical protein
MKQMGARNAGNPHVACDVEGAGNAAWSDISAYTGAPVLDPTCERPEVKFLRPTHPYIKVHGHWRYLYRAIDRSGALVDVMFSEHRDMAAAKAFFQSAKTVTMLRRIG